MFQLEPHSIRQVGKNAQTERKALNPQLSTQPARKKPKYRVSPPLEADPCRGGIPNQSGEYPISEHRQSI